MKSFEDLYNELENNSSKVKEAENLAKKESRKRNTIALILILIIDLIVILLLVKKLEISIILPGFIMPIIIFDIFILIITSLIFSKKQKEYKKIYKAEIIKNLIDNFYDDLEYFPDKQMPQTIYKEPNYIGYYNRYHSDDYMEAKIDGKYFIDMAEVHTEREETYTDSDGDTHTRTYTIFHGIFAKIIIDRSIKSNLRITYNHSGYRDRLEMDSSEFEKIFDVFASDKIIGMQLLTPDIMEEILEFKNKSKDYFDIYINENNIYLRFHCGTMFEPTRLKKGELDKKSLEKYYNVLSFIYELTNKLIKVINETEI